MRQLFSLWIPLAAWGVLAISLVSGRLADAADLGHVRGTIRFTGSVPKTDVPDGTGQRRNRFFVDPKTGGLRDAVVFWLDAPAEEPAKPDHLRPVVVDQKEFTFVPHVVSVRSGQPVKFTNSDSSNHNVRADAFEPKNQFNVLTAPGNDSTHRFVSDKKQRPTRIGCDIHPWMSAWVFAFDHSHHVVTNAKGEFDLRELPPGKLRLAIRQPDANLRRELTVEVIADKTVEADVVFQAVDLVD